MAMGGRALEAQRVSRSGFDGVLEVREEFSVAVAQDVNHALQAAGLPSASGRIRLPPAVFPLLAVNDKSLRFHLHERLAQQLAGFHRKVELFGKAHFIQRLVVGRLEDAGEVEPQSLRVWGAGRFRYISFHLGKFPNLFRRKHYFVFTTYSGIGKLRQGKNKFFLVIARTSLISNLHTRTQAMKLSPLTQVTSRRATRAHSGFTLIELLVVVAIIALLAGGSVAAYGKVMNMVKKAASQKICVEIAGAVAEFFNTYEKYPLSSASTNADVIIDDTASDGEWLGILAARGDVKDNPRKHNFIDGMKQAKFSNGKYIDGINFEESETAPTLIDPWGLGYKVVMDGDSNGEIDNPELDGSGATNPPQKVRGKKCLVYGAGPDGNFQTWGDNPKSW